MDTEIWKISCYDSSVSYCSHPQVLWNTALQSISSTTGLFQNIWWNISQHLLVKVSFILPVGLLTNILIVMVNRQGENRSKTYNFLSPHTKTEIFQSWCPIFSHGSNAWQKEGKKIFSLTFHEWIQNSPKYNMYGGPVQSHEESVQNELHCHMIHSLHYLHHFTSKI